MRDSLIALIGDYLPLSEQQLYFCSDGDLFLVAPSLAPKSIRDMVNTIGRMLNLTEHHGFAAFYRLGSHAGTSTEKLTALLEEKLLKQQQEEEQLRQKREREKLDRTRHAASRSNEQTFRAWQLATRRSERTIPQILLVTADHLVQRIVTSQIPEGCPLQCVATLEDAVVCYAELAPELLLIHADPEELLADGWLEELLALDPSATPVILWESASRSQLMQLLQQGARGFIAKPYHQEKLMHYVERVMATSRAEWSDSMAE
jgi:two-component system chemotaxis response regulator CheY